MKLTIDQLTQATSPLFVMTGDKANKKTLVSIMVEAGASQSVANKIVNLMANSGRLVKNTIVDVTESFAPVNTVEIVRNVLLQMTPESSGLTAPLVDALHTITGLSDNTIQCALNSLEQEYFLEQRRAVPPCQYIPRNWVA